MKELDLLARYIEEFPKRAFFNSPATEVEIVALEAAIGRTVPTQYREFLKRWNGGFISADWNSDDPNWNFETAEWNSVRIMSVKSALESFRELAEQLLSHEVKGKKIYVPCILGPNQELLLLDHPRNPDTEPKILDAFHECPPDEWDPIYRSFAAFLKAYVENQGAVETVASG